MRPDRRTYDEYFNGSISTIGPKKSPCEFYPTTEVGILVVGLKTFNYIQLDLPFGLPRCDESALAKGK